MLFGNFANDRIGDASAFAEASEVQLAHFTAAAHIVHQVIEISFAANKGHDRSPAQLGGGSKELVP